ncbi:MAG TPA: chromate resistance protein ChrB domain-containing protein [Vicinamibacterales bacterium]|nr:chromate resistance protein ChrB domain-containing protein [Vicinamibacterales bacterium]
MSTRPEPRPAGRPVPASARRWLLLVHQLPASPSNLRVRTWRRLQELGAIALKQSVYVLPDSADAREDFEWLRVEIAGSGGEASVFVADAVEAAADADLVDEFRRSRQAAYAELAAELQRVKQTASSKRRGAPVGSRDHLARHRQRLAAIEKIDFFGAAGRDRVLALLAAADGKSNAPESANAAGHTTAEYTDRLWVTRPLPGVDRMGSAWLIRRFIDRGARFDFCADVQAAPEGSVSFDMFGGAFTHRGQLCTFETLCAQFGIDDPAVTRLAQVVHDIDLKDHQFNAPEAPTLGAAIEGLQMACADDHALLEQGIGLFEALFRSFSQRAASPGPKPVTRRRPAIRPK